MAEPKQLVVLSGKGGTGKTTVAAALADLASRELALSLADADVDAANLELVLGAVPEATHDFTGGSVAAIDAEVCIGCGACYEACRFEAISPLAEAGVYVVDTLACEGCAACTYHCPVAAIAMLPERDGVWYRSETAYGPFYHAHLFAGGENSGKLVTLVKQQARLRALDDGRDLILIDGPPGVGCPVISALSGADLALMVVEPTYSGVHDLTRVLELAAHFGVMAVVAINKADLSSLRAREIEAFCAKEAIPIVGRIPYDDIMVKAMVRGVPVTSYTDGAVAKALWETWGIIKEKLALT